MTNARLAGRLRHLKASAAESGKPWQSHFRDYAESRLQPFSPSGAAYSPCVSSLDENGKARRNGGSHVRWVENASSLMRCVGYADKIAQRINHKGWHSDNWQYETYRGVVYQLPARNGHAVFVYGYADPCNDDCAILCFDNDYTDAVDAAYAADKFAEIHAEISREYRAKDQAEQRILSIADELAENRRALLTALAERRAACKIAAAGGAMAFPALLRVIKQGINDLLENRRELQTEREKLNENFWNAVEGY